MPSLRYAKTLKDACRRLSSRRSGPVTRAPALVLASLLTAACGCTQQDLPPSELASLEARRFEVAFSVPVSGASALPEACKSKASENFPQIVVHPSDPERLSALYFQDGTLAAVGAASTDGGRSWWRAPVADASTCSGGPAGRKNVLNPLLGIGADGVVYYGNSHGYTVAHAAQDAAGVWSRGVSPGQETDVEGAENLNLLGDASEPGKVTAVWTHFEYGLPPPAPLPYSSELQVAVSLDRARSFSPAQTLVASPTGRLIINSRLTRTSDSAMLACYDSVAVQDFINNFTRTRTNFEVKCVRSTDGATWSPPVDAGPHIFLPLADPDGRSTPGAAEGLIAGSAKFDLATGPGGRAVIVHADLDENGRGLLRLAQSSDHGATWSAPTLVIERDAPVFEPAVAIGADGTIGLFWYDWTKDETGDEALSTDAWFASSSDEGRSWQIVHLAGPFDLRAAYDADLTYDGSALGAYQDLVALPDGFGAVFTVGPPLALDGRSDVLFTRLAPP